MVPITGIEAAQSGALAVDVQNIRGAVEIVAVGTLKAPEVTVTRLEAGQADVGRFVGSQVVPGEFGSVLRVVSADTAEGKAPRCMITVRVPACDGLRVRTADGDVRVSGVGGAVDIEVGPCVSGSGGVVLVTGRALNQPVSIVTSGGPVSASIPASSELVISAQTGEGKASLVSSSARVVTTRTTVKTFEARVGGGTGDASPMSIRAMKGDVTVKVDANPR